MKHLPFGKTGLMVSPLGWGAAPAAYLNVHRRETVQMINDLLDAGMNVIDTAASYPGSEQFIGENFSDRRDEYILVTKLGHKIPENDADDWSEQLVMHTIDRAL